MSRTKRGFTLAELLIVVAIIGVLVSIAIPVFSSSLDRARTVTCQANRRSVQGMLATGLLTDGEHIKALKNGADWSAVSTALAADGYPVPEVMCPTGGTITLARAGNGMTLLCSEHGDEDGSGGGESETVSTPINTAKDQISNLGEKISKLPEAEQKKINDRTFRNMFLNEYKDQLVTISKDDLLTYFPSESKITTNPSIAWVGYRVKAYFGTRDILVATSTANTTGTDYLKGYLIYVDGQYYRSKKTTWNGSVAEATLAQTNIADETLFHQNWELVSP